MVIIIITIIVILRFKVPKNGIMAVGGQWEGRKLAQALYGEKEVFAAADDLAREGKEVTALELLSKLGGSLTTIYKHLNNWKTARESNNSAESSMAIPDAVQTAFSSVLAAAWKTAAGEATKEITKAKEKAAADVSAATKQFEEALKAIEHLEGKADADTATIEALTTKVSELEAALQRTESERAAFKAASEEQRQQIKSQQTAIERAHQENEAERNRRHEEVERITAAATTAQEKANNQIDQLRNTLNEAEQKAASLQHERDDAMKKLAETAELAAKAVHEKEEAIKEVAMTRGEAQALKEQNSELLSHLGESKKEQEAKRR